MEPWWDICRFFTVFAYLFLTFFLLPFFFCCFCPFTLLLPHIGHIHSFHSPSSCFQASKTATSWLHTHSCSLSLSRLQTAGQAETLRPCRCPPVSDGWCAGWRGAGHEGSWRRQWRSRHCSCHLPSGCGRRRWGRSCRSRCRWPSSCHLVGKEERG